MRVEQSEVFEGLLKVRDVIASESVLKVPEFYKFFKVYIDAFDKVVGG